jgi:hypothetical protein
MTIPVYRGRQKGQKNQFTMDVKEAVLEVYRMRGGPAGIAEWADQNPNDFYKLLGKLVPAEVKAEVKVSSIGSLLDEARSRRLAAQKVIDVDQSDITQPIRNPSRTEQQLTVLEHIITQSGINHDDDDLTD